MAIPAPARSRIDRFALRVPKTAELAAGRIRRQIVVGELKEGEALPSETALMAEFNISRPTLREAFRILEAERLIYVLRGGQGGARVRFPDPSTASRPVGMLLQLGGTTLNDVWEARMLIEPPLARRVAERGDRADLKELRRNIQRHHETLSDPEAFSRATVEFHDLVLKSAKNQTLHLLAEILDEIFHRHAQRVLDEHRPLGDQPELNKTTLRAHARLVALIEAGDGNKVESAWRRHLELAGGVMLKMCGPTTVIDLSEP
jgi:DNA-binding FadR family transcriptional regulator